MSLSGGTVATITAELDKGNDRYANITIVCGGNDADPTLANMPDIIEQYRRLMENALSRSRTEVVSSVLPRKQPNITTTENSDTLKAGRQILCEEMHIEFINIDDSFKLRNNPTNEGFYWPDTNNNGTIVHLNKQGTNRLAKNPKWICPKNYVAKQNSRQVTKQQRQRAKR